ncbi:MAG: endonuclease domain-containing protein [Acidimicrobiales bacterium]
MPPQSADASGRPQGKSSPCNYTHGQLALFDPEEPVVTYEDEVLDHGPLRRCGSCRRDLLVARFSRMTVGPGGLNRQCGDCSLANARVHRGVAREHAGLRPAEDQRCEICAGDGGPRGLYLDHDHATGLFRGWLCGPCNTAIGCLRDDPGLLRAAQRYLEQIIRRAA